MDKKKEMDDFLKNLKRETESRLTNLDSEIRYMSEMQKYILSDLESLKLQREAKFSTKDLAAELAGAGVDETVRKELLSLRVDQQSLFQKIESSSNKLIAVEIEVDGLKRSENLNKDKFGLGGNSPFAEDLKQQIIAVQRDVDRLRQDVVKRDIDMTKKIELSAMNGGPLVSTGVGATTTYNKPDPLVTGEDPKKLREIIKRETEHVFDFIQEFVNEIASNQIATVKSAKKGPTDKMDALDWMVRNIEFLSEKLYANFIKVCREIFEKNSPEKTSMYFSAHGSDVLISLRKVILESIDANVVPGIKKLLPSYLEALEIALLNEYNQERAVEQGIHDILILIITSDKIEDGVTLRAEKCISILLAKENLINKCVGKPEFVKWVAGCLKKKTSDISLTESRLNILSIAFKSTPVSERVLKENVSLANEVIKQLRSSKASNSVLDANVQAFFNFSLCTPLLDYVTPPELLENVIDVANEVPVNRLRQTLLKGLMNFMKKPQYLEIINSNGMADMIRAANSSS